MSIKIQLSFHRMMDTGLEVPVSFPLFRNYEIGEKLEPRRPSAKTG